MKREWVDTFHLPPQKFPQLADLVSKFPGITVEQLPNKAPPDVCLIALRGSSLPPQPNRLGFLRAFVELLNS